MAEIQIIGGVPFSIGLQSRFDGIQTGIADGSCRQALHLIGVVVTIGKRAGSRHIFRPLIGVIGGGVALQTVNAILRAKIQTVVQHRRNIRHIVCVGGFPLDDGSQNDDLVFGHAGIGDLRFQIADPVLEVIQELAHNRVHLFPFVEIVGIGEQIAFQLIIFLRGVGDLADHIVIVKVVGIDGGQEIIRGANPVFFQQRSGFQSGGTFGEGDRHHFFCLIAALQCADQILVIHVGFDLVRSRLEIFHVRRDGAIQIEKLRLANGSGFIEDLGKLFCSDIFRDRHLGGPFGTIGSEKVVGTLDQIACQSEGHQKHHAQPHQGEYPPVFPCLQLIPLFVGLLLRTALFLCQIRLVCGVLRPGRLASALGQIHAACGQVPFVNIQLETPHAAVLTAGILSLIHTQPSFPGLRPSRGFKTPASVTSQSTCLS